MPQRFQTRNRSCEIVAEAWVCAGRQERRGERLYAAGSISL